MKTDLTQLVEIMATLRHPETGCLWDLQQSHESLVPMTVDEVAELADAVAKKDSDNLCEELGDILFHLVFYAHLAEEAGDFSLQTVIDRVAEKMIRRHPHIFAGKVYVDEVEQQAGWQRIKAEEKAQNSEAYKNLSPLQKMDSLTAMAQGIAMQKQLEKMGFDWVNVTDVFAKIDEEILEVKAEMRSGNDNALREEYGDLLFSVLNLGRKLDLDPDMALRKANHKFYARSEKMIAHSGSIRAFSALNIDEKEALWQTIKS